MAQAAVRAAEPADAGVVAGLQRETWRQCYAELLPAAVLLADPATVAASWSDRLRDGGPVLLASEGGAAVGFAALSPVSDAGEAEIETLLVLPRWGRRGHGGRLLGQAADLLRTAGATRAAWWAPETDRSVERFLAGVAWFPDGARRVLDTGETQFAEIRYSGALDLVLL